MRAETIKILTALSLSAEQWAGVMQAFSIELDGTVQRYRSPSAARQARYRERLAAGQSSQTVTSDVTSDVTKASQSVTNVTVGEKESFPHTPFKEKTNPNLTVSITPLNPPTSLFENLEQAFQDQSLPDGFEEFWDIYPKRAGGADKKNAIKAYRAAIKRALPSAVLIGAKNYHRFLESEGKIGTPFVRQARTWLNADQWMEEYHATTVSKPTRLDEIDAAGKRLKDKLRAAGHDA